MFQVQNSVSKVQVFIFHDKIFICGVDFNGLWMKKFWKTGFDEKKFEKKSLKELFEIKFN